MYLSQLFQAMRQDKELLISMFLLRVSKEYASMAHNILWFAKVEQVEDG